MGGGLKDEEKKEEGERERERRGRGEPGGGDATVWLRSDRAAGRPITAADLGMRHLTLGRYSEYGWAVEGQLERSTKSKDKTVMHAAANRSIYSLWSIQTTLYYVSSARGSTE